VSARYVLVRTVSQPALHLFLAEHRTCRQLCFAGHENMPQQEAPGSAKRPGRERGPCAGAPAAAPAAPACSREPPPASAQQEHAHHHLRGETAHALRLHMLGGDIACTKHSCTAGLGAPATRCFGVCRGVWRLLYLLGRDLAQPVLGDAGALAHHDALQVRQRRQQQQREAHVRHVVAAADADVLQACREQVGRKSRGGTSDQAYQAAQPNLTASCGISSTASGNVSCEQPTCSSRGPLHAHTVMDGLLSRPAQAGSTTHL
jgi:hypothetical protein